MASSPLSDRSIPSSVSLTSKMEVSWRIIIPLIIVSSFIIYEEWVTTPSCKNVLNDIGLTGARYSTQEQNENDNGSGNEYDLKVMMAANLLLLGSEGGHLKYRFRDYYLSKFFRKSLATLNPDLLIVLGDISAKGYELTQSMWYSVLQQFHEIIGPFYSLPFHVVLGDRDVGLCNKLNRSWVGWIASRFTGLDSAGSGVFEISNISFVSLNAVALLCGNNDLRFNVEKVIERERTNLQIETEDLRESRNEPSKEEGPYDTQWRENAASSGSGPVLLLHFPLHQKGNNCSGSAAAGTLANSFSMVNRGLSSGEPYEVSHTLPPNATEYVFQALRPRIVFSAHRHEFCVHTHSDGIHEVTVPAMAWDARDDPGFVVATFKKNGTMISISRCALAKESHVLLAYMSCIVLLASTMLVLNKSNAAISS